MRIQRLKPQLLRVDLHPLELASLVTAARWVVADGEGPLPDEALQELARVLASYDRELAAVHAEPSRREGR